MPLPDSGGAIVVKMTWPVVPKLVPVKLTVAPGLRVRLAKVSEAAVVPPPGDTLTVELPEPSVRAVVKAVSGEAVDGDGVVAARRPGVPVPRGEALGQGETGGGGKLVVAVEAEPAGYELEAGHHQAAGPDMAGDVLQHGPLGAGDHEDHHVAGHDGGVEAAAPVRRDELEIGQIGQHPVEVGRLGPGGRQHPGVGVHADDVETPPGELDGHPAGAGAGVEHGPDPERLDERRLTVHVGAGGGDRGETAVVLPALGLVGEAPGAGAAEGGIGGQSVASPVAGSKSMARLLMQ